MSEKLFTCPFNVDAQCDATMCINCECYQHRHPDYAAALNALVEAIDEDEKESKCISTRIYNAYLAAKKVLNG